MPIPVLGTRIKAFDTRRVQPAPKAAASVYHTPEFKRWRAEVVGRAGGRCEAIEGGMRCLKAQPAHRMFADHRVELRDGGAPFDVENGQCLCGGHHTAKTARARAARARATTPTASTEKHGLPTG